MRVLAGRPEPPTTIGNHHRLLMVGGTGDPAVPYAGQLVMHQALHGSRMVTLNGAFGHVQYLKAGNACVDTTVQNYLLGAPCPATTSPATSAEAHHSPDTLCPSRTWTGGSSAPPGCGQLGGAPIRWSTIPRWVRLSSGPAAIA